MSALTRAAIVALGVACLFAAGPAGALAPGRTVGQFQSTTWTLKDGAPPDIWAIAQTPDGYLWLGTGAGLFRFDGVRFEPVRPAGPKSFPLANILSLLATPAGDVWIGYLDGSASVLRNGRLTTYTGAEGLPAGPIHQFARTPDGTIWAAPHSALARLDGARWRTVGPEAGITDPWAYALLAGREGDLWVTTKTRLFHRPSGASRFLDTRLQVQGDGSSLAQAPDGRVWLSDPLGGARPLTLRPDGTVETAGPKADPAKTLVARPFAFAFDHNGNLWGSEAHDGGLYEVPSAQLAATRGRLPTPPAANRLTVQQGLPSSVLGAVMEDREGNVWVGSNLGLVQFRDPIFIPQAGVPYQSATGYEALRSPSGDLYVASGSAATTFHGIGPNGAVSSFTPKITGVLKFEFDGGDGLWLGTDHGLFHFDGKRLTQAVLPRPKDPATPQYVRSLARDRSGTIWVGIYQTGLFRLDPTGWTHVVPRDDLTAATVFRIGALRDGGVWLDMGRKGDALAKGDAITFFGRQQTPKLGPTGVIDGDGPGVLFSSETGLHWFDGRRFWTLSGDQIAPFRRVSGIARTPDGYVWLASMAGVTRVKAEDLYARFQHPDRALDYRLLDYRDGLPGPPQQDSATSSLVAGPDGRLWIQTNQGVVWFDPARIDGPGLAPPVKILSLVADGQAHPAPGALRLQPGVSNLQINYTALSLTEPDRIRFRYRLDGVDTDWVDAGVRRQAIYTRLGPGDYRFQVIAANSRGTWSRTGQTLAFTIPPTFVQSKLFLVLAVLAAALIVGLMFWMRVRQVADRLRGQLEERLAERERIARELHDTLLQAVQGLVLRFHAIARQTPKTSPTRPLMEEVLGRADQVIAEGRDRVQDLRSATRTNTLEGAFADTADEFPDHPAVLTVLVAGRPREVHPMVAEEIASIGREALRNAFLHADARRLDVTLTYLPSRFELMISDDGKGLDPAFAEGRAHHFGIVGMRERAQKLQADLALGARPQGGTELRLQVPARVAYVATGWLTKIRRARGEHTT